MANEKNNISIKNTEEYYIESSRNFKEELKGILDDTKKVSGLEVQQL